MTNWFKTSLSPKPAADHEDKAFDEQLDALGVVVSEMRGSVEELSRQIKAAELDERQLGSLVEQAEERMELCQKEAETAVLKGDDELAHKALMERNIAQERRARHVQVLTEQRKALTSLRESWSELQTNVREYEGRYMEIKHKQRTIMAYKQAGQMDAAMQRAQAIIDRALERVDMEENMTPEEPKPKIFRR